MRRIGTLTDPDLARRFADFLFTLSIECNVDIEDAPQSDGAVAATTCNLWIRDESHVPRAKQELEAFLQSPTDEKYRVGEEADRIRKQRQSDEKRKKRLQQKVNPKSPATGSGGLMGVPIRQQTIPVVIAMVILSVIASFSTGFGQPKPSQVPGELSTEETIFYGLSFVDWRDYVISKDPLASIKKGQVWRLVTPLFLHGDTYHLAFNMLGIFFLGSAIERLQGSWFMAFLLLASGIFGGLVQIWLPPEEALPELFRGLAGSPFSIGASGAVYGLFGYLWIRPALSPSYPVRMMPSNVAIMLGWLVFCIFFVERIANGAHLGGLIAGVVIAVVVSRMPSDRFA
ncbi:Rhomboid protease GlpG [Stieleria maiorica]|uniref:Rhomboid protease GlpG n=1 Tax=Stieleria maiorica TaxID=2795974 RepID=A0A5B9MNJ9_9BACT|nr:rhomboid family intramembrane serine protease [Stieleria maiorica]QEG01156.1 Rhomboid protease GlpG [Stieleria maiorica]